MRFDLPLPQLSEAQPDADGLNQIKVYSFVDFAHALRPPPATGPVVESLESSTYLSSTRELQRFVAENWETLALLTIVSVCVIASLLWLRNNAAAGASGPAVEQDAARALASNTDVLHSQAVPADEAAVLEVATSSDSPTNGFAANQDDDSDDLKENLSEFIKSNADDTQRILQQWIREAA